MGLFEDLYLSPPTQARHECRAGGAGVVGEHELHGRLWRQVSGEGSESRHSSRRANRFDFPHLESGGSPTVTTRSKRPAAEGAQTQPTSDAERRSLRGRIAAEGAFGWMRATATGYIPTRPAVAGRCTVEQPAHVHQ
jgi:hypothetical protein